MNRRQFLMASGHAFWASALAGCAAPGQRSSAVTDLTRADGVALLQMMREGRTSNVEVLEALIARCEAVNGRVNAVVYKSYEAALDQARTNPAGRIGGLPYLIKDLTDVAGMTTTHGSRAFVNRTAEEDAPYVRAIKAGGGVIFGKTNTPEFGLIGTTESIALGPCRNPWNLDHSTGGSSGGAAAAVAAGIVPVAQASDGGGSIRIPASCCGLVGLKPTRGRMVGEEGQTKMNEIAVRHAVSRSVRDNALLLAVTEGRGSDALPPVGFVTEPLDRPLRVGVSVASTKGTPPDPDVARAIEATSRLCETLGHHVEPATPAWDGQAFEDAFLDLWSQGAWYVRNSIAENDTRPIEELLEPWTLFLADHFERNVSDAGIERAMATFAAVARQVETFMEGYDVWLTPVLSSPPPPIGQQAPTVAVETLLRRTFDYVSYTPLANAMGTPALSLPLGQSANGLPIGSMFMGQPGADGLLLQLGYQLEAAAPWLDRWAAAAEALEDA